MANQFNPTKPSPLVVTGKESVSVKLELGQVQRKERLSHISNCELFYIFRVYN